MLCLEAVQAVTEVQLVNIIFAASVMIFIAHDVRMSIRDGAVVLQVGGSYNAS